MEHWKKNGKKVQQKVCISTKLQHTSRTAAQDVISAVSWIRGRENWYWCRMKLFQSPSDYDTLSQLQANRRRVGMRVGRNQTENPKEFVCMDLSATGRRLVRLGCRHSSSCVCVFDSNDRIIIINCKSSGNVVAQAEEFDVGRWKRGGGKKCRPRKGFLDKDYRNRRGKDFSSLNCSQPRAVHHHLPEHRKSTGLSCREAAAWSM